MRPPLPNPLDDPPGARESNAGDEFHILWGVSLCLRMIRPDSPLHRIVIEDVSPTDRAGSSGRAFLAADITEYYGGDDFEQATEVVLSQLKYSHRNPSRLWTAAQLAPSGSVPEKTVLGKLAAAYSEYKRQFGRVATLEKLTIRLTSNRPGHPKLLRLLEECQSCLTSRPRPTLNRTVTDSIDRSLRRSYELLFQRSGLSQREFTDFIRVLNFDSLGSGDRFEHDRRIVATLSEHVLGDVAGAARKLYEYVRKEALPEAAGSYGIGRADVLACLGVTGWSDLLPMASRVEKPQFLIPQPDAEHLAEAITGGAYRRVVAHGDAGVGKTTSLVQLENSMPRNSVVVLYDCFAGGEYLCPTERRHVPQYAVRQLINEIALRCGTSLLLTDAAEELVLWRKLAEVIATAAHSLAETGAHLVLAIDAADNAIVAASERQNDQCFVPDLWRLCLPDNVHIVMTCRSARLGLISAPDDVHEIELTGFDDDASAAHFRYYFPEATDTQCRDFHANSGGNPRLQFYVLDLNRPDRPMTPDGCIDQAATTTGALFDDLLETAVHSRLATDDSHEWLAVLMAMERPIRVESLAAVLDVGQEDVYRFCRGLVPGIRIENDTIAFRDEDFETHVRSRCTQQDLIDAHGQIADCYLKLKATHGWAAEAVAGHLFNAGLGRRLVKLAIEDREPSAIADPLARNQAYLRRISLALRITASAERPDSLKLIALAAAMKRADSAVAVLIREMPELAMRHADPVAVARVYEAEGDDAWKGPLHMRVAASAARDGDRDTARTQVELAMAWLRRWSGLDDRDRSRWQLEADDIAALAEAMFYLRGPNAAAAAVRGWRPASFSLDVAESLVERLTRGPDRAELARHVEEQGLLVEVEAHLLAVLFRNGLSASPSQLERISRRLIERPPRVQRDRDASWIADLAEQAALVVDDATLVNLMEALRPNSPHRAPYDGLGDWEIPLRLACLEAAVRDTALDAESLLPGRLSESAIDSADRKDRHGLQEQRRKLLEFLAWALDLYRLRASSIAGKIDADKAVDQSLQLLEAISKEASYRYIDYEWHQRFRVTAIAVFDALCLVDADLARPCEKLLSIVPGDTVPLSTWLNVAELILRHGTDISTALRVVDRVVQETQALDEPAQEQATRLLRCATLVDPIDGILASDYYSAGIKASSGLDEERAQVLHLMNHLANSLSETHRVKALPLAPRLRQAVERFRPFTYEPEALPWMETLEAVTSLNPTEGLRTLTLWDESGDLPLEHGIGTVTKTLTARGIIDVVVAVHLLWLTDESKSCTGLVLELLDRALEEGRRRPDLAAAVSWLAERIARHMTLDVRLTEAAVLAAWIEMNGFENAPWAAKIRRIHNMVQELPVSDQERSEYHYRGTAALETRHNRVAHLLALASSDGPADLVQRLGELAEEWAPAAKVVEYLGVFGESLSPDARIQALEAIVQLPPDSHAWTRNSQAIVQGLARWISAWNSADSVHSWLSQYLPGLFLSRYPSIVGFNYERETSLATYLDIDVLDDPVGLALEATSRDLHSLTTRHLVRIAMTISDHLPEHDRLSNVTWLLDDLLGDVDTNTEDKAELQGLELLADFSWALLGHPDKYVRWRAAHLVLDLSRASSVFIDYLFANIQDRTGFGYYAPTSEFLWMSAQVWTLLCLRRIAVDNPEVVRDVIPMLRNMATSVQWPHALLREIARRTLLEYLTRTDGVAFSDQDEIVITNQPRACRIDRRYRIRRERAQSDEPRFWFDSLDTVRYWFDPLGDVFGITARDVELRADHWVVDRLGYDNNIVRADRPKFSNRYDYHHYSNNHGTQPRVENLRTHLEWHAMFLVAGELIDSGTELVVPDYRDAEDSWDDWLMRFLNPLDGLWIADLRESVPPSTRLHTPNPQQATWRHVSEVEYDHEIMVDDALVVSASLTNSYRALYESIYVNSALVSPESAISLLLSLQSTENHRSFALPLDDGNHEIDEPNFQLLGWLEEMYLERTGLDEHDPIRRISLRTVIPGHRFTHEVEDAFLLNEQAAGEDPPRHTVQVRRWSDEPANQRTDYRSRYTDGQQTLVRTSELLNFLSESNKELILEVIISRNFASTYRNEHEEEEEYDLGTARIYLLRRSGILIDGMGRYGQLGTGNCGAAKDR